MKLKRSQQHTVWWIAAAVAILRLSLLPFVQNTDSDAVTRIYMSLDWLEHPHWIMSGIWGPFHFYLNAFFLWIGKSPEYAPAIGNIILSALTLVPVYHFTKRVVGAQGALATAIFLGVSPVIFRVSFMGLSETPYLFFLALSLERISKALSTKRSVDFIIAGVFITIAGGFRYEAWIVSAVLALVILMLTGFRHTLVFGLAAIIFPVIWMVQCRIDTGNAFFSFQGNSEWTMTVMENNKDMDLESWLRRIWFFPFVWMISVGPMNAYLILRNIFYFLRKRIRSYYLWALPFLAILLFFEINAFRGILLLQTRFIGTIVLLSLPLAAPSFQPETVKRNRLMIVSAILMLILSFAYNINDVSPLPRLKDQSYARAATEIRENADPAGGLIIDFCNWDNSYYMALHSGVDHNNIVIFYLSPVNPLPAERIARALQEHNEGIIVVRRSSPLENEIAINNDVLSFHGISVPSGKFFENENIVMYKWKK